MVSVTERAGTVGEAHAEEWTYRILRVCMRVPGPSS